MQSFLRIIAIFCLIILSSCIARSEEYRDFYAHLNHLRRSWTPMQEEDYFLIILVDACHLDYTKADRFFHSVAKHPIDGRKGGEVGHAWIYLQGKFGDQVFVLEGGHSGEIEETPVRYFDGIMNYNDFGYANPTLEQMQSPCHEPNPIQYLWTTREDGYFQKGSGGHCPTFAAKISLTAEQFTRILNFVRPRHYPYRHYALMGPQCCSFVSKVAALAGLSLAFEVQMQVPSSVFYGKMRIHLWEDPCYSLVTFGSPDVVEKSLIEAVENGQAEYALDWYRNNKSEKKRAFSQAR